MSLKDFYGDYDYDETKSFNDYNLPAIDDSDFENLPGIGEFKAKTIVKYRDNYGPLKTIDDLKNVSGIGDALFEKIKLYIKI